jgi:hypothetical protein
MPTSGAPGFIKARRRRRSEALIGRRGYAAAVTDHHRLPAFHRKKRDEKEAQVVIDSLQSGLSQPTSRTQPRSVIDGHGFRLDTADQKKHHLSRKSILRVIAAIFYHNYTEKAMRQNNGPTAGVGLSGLLT